MYAQGYTQKEIGKALGITAGTARRHVDNIAGNFNPRPRRAELVRWAAAMGLLDDLVLG